MRDFLEEYKSVLIICFVILFISLLLTFVNAVVKSGQARNISNVEKQITTTENEISSKSAEKMKLEEDVKKSAGVDSDRVKKDTQTVTSFLKTAATWDSYESYKKVYENISKNYPEKDNKAFYSFFVNPSNFESPEGTFNMQFVSLGDENLRVTKVSGDVYSYFTEVVIKTSDKNGKSKTGVFAFSADIDSKGNMKNLYASRIYE